MRKQGRGLVTTVSDIQKPTAPREERGAASQRLPLCQRPCEGQQEIMCVSVCVGGAFLLKYSMKAPMCINPPQKIEPTGIPFLFQEKPAGLTPRGGANAAS